MPIYTLFLPSATRPVLFAPTACTTEISNKPVAVPPEGIVRNYSANPSLVKALPGFENL